MQTAIAMPKDRTRKMIGAGFFVVLTLIGSFLLLSLFGILPLLMKAPCGIGQYFFYMLIGAALAFPAVLAYMFVPLIIDRFDPEPWWALLMAFIWGGFAATGFAGIINTFTGALLGRAFGTVVSAPLVEEFFKALLVLGMFWFLRTEFDGVVDGVIYATFTALGFATVENVIYYSNAGWKAYVAHGLCNSDHAMNAIAGTFLLRGILSPWGHPLYTSMTGIGIGLAREVNNRFLKFVFPIVGFFLAVTLHGVWNLSAVLGAGPLFLTYILYIFFIILFTIIMIVLVIRERGIIKKFLTDEVLVGTLTEEEAALASSPVGRIKAIMRGGRTYRKLVNAAATLALKKWHVTRAMKGNKSTVSMDFIVPLRQQIKQLHDKLVQAKGPQPPTSPPQGGGYGGPPQGGGYGGPPQGGGYGGPPQGGGYGGPPQGGGYGGPPQGGGYGGPPQGGGYGGPPQGGGYGSPR